jgi:wobble nucleotide-excising tRNase
LPHLARGGEAWIEQGIPRIRGVSPEPERKLCPFCAQEISGSALIRDYQTYFDESYRALKAEVDACGKALASAHGGDNRATFERAVRVAVETRESWIRYVEIPEITFDTARVSDAWRAAREAVFTVLRAKQAAPLDAMSLSPEATAAVEAFQAERQIVLEASQRLVALNPEIAHVKERSFTADLTGLRNELSLLKATQARHAEPTASRCAEYLAEKVAKQATEQARDMAGEALENYSRTIFPRYQTALNEYLERFNAGFRLDSVSPRGTRGGTVCSYSVLINEIPVDIMASTGPSFKTTLSAGDRNTLALAFFFASLDADPSLAQMTVVIDDPMTSLDEHRSLATVQEIRRLGDRVDQLIILSHSKPFLCAMWESNASATKAALSIIRYGNGSTLAAWDVTRDCITEHDRRHQMIQTYIAGGAAAAATARYTAIALRPTLEGFIRVAYPEVFEPGCMLGNFVTICRQRVGTANQLLSQSDADELDQIVDYANRFHHNTNPNCVSALINDQELLRYCRRTIAFTRRTVPPARTTP